MKAKNCGRAVEFNLAVTRPIRGRVCLDAGTANKAGRLGSPLDSVIEIFDKDNKLITHLGDNPGVEKTKGYPNLPHDQRIPGKFISPHAACWDHEGNLYVVEWINDGRVSKFRHVS